jgi:UDP-2-acetamido-2,6-beta-L-arabino-hexul-4-ose reductase
MKRIGITGQNGFVGKHLFNTIGLQLEKYERIEFKREFFDNTNDLDSFVSQCDVIVHLAALNRHESQEFIFETNVQLVNILVASLKRTRSKAHIIFSSSSQEERDNLYGKSKKLGREKLIEWAASSGGKVSGLVIPNVFGSFGQPFYNSFIATFCYQLTHGDQPIVAADSEVQLIYVAELVDVILNEVENDMSSPILFVGSTSNKKVSEVLSYLEIYKEKYFENGEVPALTSSFEVNLFNTFRSYINHSSHYPVKFKQHTDPRGAFVEVIRLGLGGQVSFSTTVPGITRGNHFHTRKIERFAVIKGKALIQLRKIDNNEVIDFYLDGNEPAYVDMPIWYTHNIKNIGNEELYTIFWINELYNPEDTDTYFVEV